MCLRNDVKYFRFFKYLNFGLMYNMGFAAMLAEEKTFSICTLAATLGPKFFRGFILVVQTLIL